MMKKSICFFLILIVSLASCKVDTAEKEGDDDASNLNFENHWFFDFDGLITGGEGFDIIKSSTDNKIYVCGVFLHVNNNWDMKNLTRWDIANNKWEQVPGIDQYHNNFIRCVAQDNNGNLYFGGDFSSIGGVQANKIGKFNPATSNWSPLYDSNYAVANDQYGPTGGGVYATVISGNYLYIGGGTFTTSTNQTRYIRRFNLNTNTWESVGTGTNGRVLALAVDQLGNVYAGGEFTEAGGVTANFIAKWNGNTWEALGQGVDDYVLTLNYANGNLYAGGSFIHVGSNITSRSIALWNGTNWQAMQKGVKASWGNTGTVQDIAVDEDGKVYIGGFFDRNNGDYSNINHVAVFENNKWKPLGDGLATSSSQGVIGMMADGKNIYFTGYFTKGTGSPNAKKNIAIWNENK